jgi:NO-binding membrane sensor protein with MHYT domain
MDLHDEFHTYNTHVDPVLIVIACALSFVGAFATIQTFEQFRLCKLLDLRPKLYPADALHFFLALFFGVFSLCTILFFILCGCLLIFPPHDSYVVPVYYRADMTIVSLFVVILFTYAGLYVCSLDGFYSKDRTDAIAEFYEKSRALSINAVMKQGKYAFLMSTLFHNVAHLVAGGTITGGGVVIMHYTGVAAMRFQGHIDWHAGNIASSVFVAVIACTVAFWILFRLLVVFSRFDKQLYSFNSFL